MDIDIDDVTNNTRRRTKSQQDAIDDARRHTESPGHQPAGAESDGGEDSVNSVHSLRTSTSTTQSRTHDDAPRANKTPSTTSDDAQKNDRGATTQ
jgi:hypothetical protein